MSTHYYAHLNGRDSRIYLAQRAGGWKPLLHWHAGEYGCPCHCDRHWYRNWDEFKAFVRSDDVTITNEYGETLEADEFIGMLAQWRNDNDRSHIRQTDVREAVEIDGWEFIGGHWE